MPTAPLVTAEMLRATLTRETYMAIFDDEQTGSTSIVDASLGVTLILRRSHTRVEAQIAVICAARPLPSGTDDIKSDLLLDAELSYAVGMSFDRHAEYVRAYGEDPRRKGAYDQAKDVMEAIQAGIMRIVDSSVEAVKEPTNVGGFVLYTGRRVMLPNSDGTSNSGDF